MQGTLSQTIHTINQLEESAIGDLIWNFYYQGEEQNRIQSTQKDCIEELKNIQESVKANIKFKYITRNKALVIDCINKKKNHNDSGITSIFHKNYKIFFDDPDKIEYRMPLDTFIHDLLCTGIVNISDYIYRRNFEVYHLYYWKRNLKRIFITKLMFYTYIHIFWNDTYIDHYYTKNGKTHLVYMNKNYITQYK